MIVNFNGLLFDSAYLYGLTLYAKQPVNVYSNPYDRIQIATVTTGNPIGVVEGYVGGQVGQPLYWQFLRPDGSAYYVEHKPNAFNVSALQEQGLLTVEQQIEQQNQEDSELFPGLNLPSFDVKNIAVLAGVVVGGLILFKLIRK